MAESMLAAADSTSAVSGGGEPCMSQASQVSGRRFLEVSCFWVTGMVDWGFVPGD